MTKNTKELVFSRNVVEFVTVALEYCAYIEKFSNETAFSLTDRFTKLLPLMYLKATLLPETELLEECDPKITVTEEDYNFICSKLYAAYTENDTYLEVFLEDMKYSDTPIAASISEDLTDIYQDLKNFLCIYEQGVVDNMNDALYVCDDNFKNYWGQKLVNVLRALHSFKHNSDAESLDDNSIALNKDEEW